MFAFEKRFLTDEDTESGLIPARFHIALTLTLLALLIAISYTSFTGLLESLIWGAASLILARLIALDLTHHTLPNIYVIPLALLGLLAAYVHLTPLHWQDALMGGAIAFVGMMVFACLIEALLRSAFLGGGDIKFIGAAGLWLGWQMLPFFLMIACFFSLIFSLLPSKNHHIAFGPGLCLSFWLFLHQKNATMALITKAFAFIS